MPIKTRDPHSLGASDYLSWLKRVLEWLGDHSGDPDFPSHLTGGFEDKITAFKNALTNYNKLKELSDWGKSDLFDRAFKVLFEKLRTIQIALPTVAPNPPVLAEFGLAEPIPNDKDDIYIVAQNALAHWADVSGEPQFAPLTSDFTELQNLLDDYVAKRDEYYDIFNQKQTAQNEMLQTREECNKQERSIFTWYRSRHRIPTDEWWTETPWGASSGKKKKLHAPKNLSFDAKKQKLSWDVVPTADKYEAEVLDEQGNIVFSGDTDKDNIKVENIQEQIEYKARVRAVKLGSPAEYSQWSEGIAVFLGVPLVPQNLRWHPAEYHGDIFALIEWDAAAGADSYELEFDPEGGDAEIFDVGDRLYKYEDIMHTPRTYKYRVRGKNDFGVGDWSATLKIVIE
ncbi:hypothetical protein J7M00_06395 [bacterium]|nr:hypothetical protein [bacterium]